MNNTLIKCIPVLVLTLALGACSKKSDDKLGGAAPATSAARDTVETSFEAVCDSKAAAAAAEGTEGVEAALGIAAVPASYDLTSCQLSEENRTLVREIGPLKVEADCAAKYVKILNKEGLVVGESQVNEEGLFAAPLNLGESFSEAAGCPVLLQGQALGSVTCSEEGKVTKIDMNTEFSLAQWPAEEEVAPEAPVEVIDGTTPATAPAPASAIAMAANADHDEDMNEEHDRDHRDHDRGNQSGKGKQPAQPAKGKGKDTPAQTQPGKDKGQQADKGKGKDNPGQQQPGKGKGKTETAKGGQQGRPHGHDRDHDGGERMAACAAFNPCAFSSSATLSCSQ